MLEVVNDGTACCFLFMSSPAAGVLQLHLYLTGALRHLQLVGLVTSWMPMHVKRLSVGLSDGGGVLIIGYLFLKKIKKVDTSTCIIAAH